MKFIHLVVLTVMAYICCWGAAEQPPAELVRSKIVQAPPVPEPIVFALKQAKIIIFMDDPEFAFDIRTSLQDTSIKHRLVYALNVVVRETTIINNANQLIAELNTPDQAERIIFTAGDKATKLVLTYLSKDLPQAGIVNSVILFDPTIPSTRYAVGSQLIPRYNYISNRIYNFYSKSAWGTWRKIFPADRSELPAKGPGDRYYFKGININAEFLDESGTLAENFNFSQMNSVQFQKIIETIAQTNRFLMQPDLLTIVQNNTLRHLQSTRLQQISDAYLPIVTIHNPLLFKDRPHYEIQLSVVNVTGLSATYECVVPKALAKSFETEMMKEKAYSDYQKQMMYMPAPNIMDFSIVEDNPFTQEKLGDEAIEKVETGIHTYYLEQEYINLRRERVREALHNLCPEATRPINIAIVASGGGSRAMFATFGAIKALLDMGVLAATSYFCGLSGSTWAMSMLYNEMNDIKNEYNVNTALHSAIRNAVKQAPSFDFIRQALVNGAVRPISKYIYTAPAAIQVKKGYGQPVTNTDYYGSSIAQYLLGRGDEIYGEIYGPNYLRLQLGKAASWQRKNKDLPAGYDPILPFPIYTAVSPLSNVAPRLFPWFEFTPYQIGAVLGTGNDRHGMFVKPWAFGRKFDDGLSVGFAPEQALEFYLGVFSSAMNATVKESISLALTKHQMETATSWLQWIPLSGYINPEYRSRFAEVYNPMFGMKEFRPYKNVTTIGLIDAGLAFNLPFPPLNDYKGQRLERKPDVIIFIDASADSDDVNILGNVQAWPDGSALRAVETYAHENEVPFPQIEQGGNLAEDTFSAFGEKEQQSPVVIYLPLTKQIAELKTNAEFKGGDLKNKVIRDNKFEKTEPSDLTEIDLSIYKTKYTAMNPQHAVNLMALMEYNVLFHEKEIKRAICDRARQAAAR